MPTILILGASSDIGVAIARKFATEKYDVQLAGRNTKTLEIIQSDISIRYNVKCTVHAFDAMNFADHNEFYSSLDIKPDVTCYVAGYMIDNEEAFQNLEKTLNTIHTNYTGAVSILNVIAREYAARKQGVIIGISSVAGNRGRQSNYIYGSAKAGFTAYLSGLRNHLYHHGVHVMTVLPGFVFTKLTEHLKLPPLLTAKPEDVANRIFRGVKNKSNIIYVKWFWRWIMVIIVMIPESIFKKKKL